MSGPGKVFDKCCWHHGRKKNPPVVEEKCKKYRPDNPDGKYLEYYRVDKCLIPSNAKSVKCDNLVTNCDEKIAYFVELKGSDVPKAAEQIYQSIIALRPNIEGWTINARIVPAKVPAPNIPHKRISDLKRLVKAHNGTYECKAREFPETL